MLNIRLMQGICGGLLLLSASSLAGIAIDTTRIIFSANDNAAGTSTSITSSSQSQTPLFSESTDIRKPLP